MKKLNIISTLLLILISIRIQAQGNFKINPNGDNDLAVVEAYLNAISSRNEAQLGKTHASNYVEYGPRWNSPATKEDMIQNIKSVWNASSKNSYERIRMIPISVSEDEIPEYNGNWVFIWGVFTAKSKDSEKEVYLDIHQNFKIENGLITLSVVYYNQLDTMIQTGQYTGD